MFVSLLIIVSFAGCIEQTDDENKDVENNQSLPSINYFSSDKTEIINDTTLNLSWKVENANKVNIIPSLGNLSSQGSIELSPSQSTTYTLIAHNDYGNVTESIDITLINTSENTPGIYFSAGYNENYLLVTSVSGNFSWNNILLNDQEINEDDLDAFGGNYTGKIKKGDRLIDLRGNVSLTWKPTNQPLGHWNFS